MIDLKKYTDKKTLEKIALIRATHRKLISNEKLSIKKSDIFPWLFDIELEITVDSVVFKFTLYKAIEKVIDTYEPIRAFKAIRAKNKGNNTTYQIEIFGLNGGIR
jgi:hypothetical protein